MESEGIVEEPPPPGAESDLPEMETNIHQQPEPLVVAPTEPPKAATEPEPKEAVCAQAEDDIMSMIEAEQPPDYAQVRTSEAFHCVFVKSKISIRLVRYGTAVPTRYRDQGGTKGSLRLP